MDYSIRKVLKQIEFAPAEYMSVIEMENLRENLTTAINKHYCDNAKSWQGIRFVGNNTVHLETKSIWNYANTICGKIRLISLVRDNPYGVTCIKCIKRKLSADVST